MTYQLVIDINNKWFNFEKGGTAYRTFNEARKVQRKWLPRTRSKYGIAILRSDGVLLSYKEGEKQEAV